MSRHSFDPQVAVQVGLNAAVIYQNICFWVEKNEANGHNFRDGRYWTYNSVSAFAKLFPYFSPKQVRVAIDKLIEAGLIVKGNYAGDKYDRTAWYALNSPICPQGQMDSPHKADGCAIRDKLSAPEGKCNRNSYNPDEKPYPPCADAQGLDAGFQKIWEAYPQDRLRKREECRVLIAQVLSEAPADDLAVAARSYAVESAEFTRSKVSFIDNWLRDGKWRRHVEERRLSSEMTQPNGGALQKVLARHAEWVRTRSPLCRTMSPGNFAELISQGLVTREEASAARIGL
ncbi:hypothetical protein [Paracoccus sp. (in: a-proteobacteria)]|uniref:hypothetical protein n=1 Tax=Paracoccus sp. TaxID=267 RepID=UPI0026DFFD8B|nr:hypothetical protein [Paracoccus sp. (in: a-proteobacteria)]MDO5646339.1 hypothetical protein [Paracoccus sp. (in: a-proteobacteria)]